MTIRICSGFSPLGLRQYGDRFLRTFDRHWPDSIELRVYVEQAMPMPRLACQLLWDIPGARAFWDRHRPNPLIAGRAALPCWKDRERRLGYSFRTDALKFFKQILIPGAAAEDMQAGDYLAWIDADVETTRRVPADLIPDLLAGDDVVYLGREGSHSEIGFWAVRINNRTRAFLDDMARIYVSDEFMQLREFHSAFVWDHARKRAALRERNLTPGGRGHVWPRSALAPFMRHDKGARKPRI